MLKMEGSVFLVFVIFAVLPSLLAATNWSPSLVCHVPLELRIFGKYSSLTTLKSRAVYVIRRFNS